MEIKCPNCKYEGKGKFINKGSFGVEIILWLLFLLPGLVYSVWRLCNRIVICPDCRFEHVKKINRDPTRDYRKKLY